MNRRHGEPQTAPGLVLIVEDEMPIAEALSEIVAEAGYRVLVASNGRAGLDLARAERPSLIITDLMMPYLDGAGMIAALRSEDPGENATPIPIVVMTAAGRGFAERVPYDALLPKPFDIFEVEHLLDRFLSRRDQAQQSTKNPPTDSKE